METLEAVYTIDENKVKISGIYVNHLENGLTLKLGFFCGYTPETLSQRFEAGSANSNSAEFAVEFAYHADDPAYVPILYYQAFVETPSGEIIKGSIESFSPTIPDNDGDSEPTITGPRPGGGGGGGIVGGGGEDDSEEDEGEGEGDGDGDDSDDVNGDGDGDGSDSEDPNASDPEVFPPTELPHGGSWPSPYSDVDATHWFFEAVRFVTEGNLMIGTGEGVFSPGTGMSRAMLVTVLYRLEGSPEVNGEIPFSDVNNGEWYSDAILWANQNGVVGGYTDGTFGLDDLVTREQTVTILYRHASSKGADVSASADLSAFSDSSDISDWALPALGWAVEKGIVLGRTEESIEPKGTSTRAEVAMILKRFVELSDRSRV